jgi:hypothetical protein
MHDRPAGRLEARITGYALTLAVGMWAPAIYFLFMPGNPFESGNGLGGDFRFFYVIATLAHRGEFASLYDKARILELGRTLMPDLIGSFAYPSAYPPVVALAIAPIAALPYSAAIAVWTLASTGLYAAACRMVWRRCRQLAQSARTVVACAAAFPAFFLLIVFGQSTAPAVLLLSVAFVALADGRAWLAGLAIGGLVYKPQLAVGLAIVLLLAREWRIVLGAAASAPIITAIAWMGVGTHTMSDYVHTLLDTSTLVADLEPNLYHLHSLKGFFALLLPWPVAAMVAYVASSILVVVAATRLWRSAAPLGVRFAALLLTTVLVDPHLNVYDLVVLAPAFLLLADWITGENAGTYRSAIVKLSIASLVLPLIGPLAAWTHLQPSVLAMAGLFVVVGRAAVSRPRREIPQFRGTRLHNS